MESADRRCRRLQDEEVRVARFRLASVRGKRAISLFDGTVSAFETGLFLWSNQVDRCTLIRVTALRPSLEATTMRVLSLVVSISALAATPARCLGTDSSGIVPAIANLTIA